MAVDLGETRIDWTLPRYRPMPDRLQANILKSHGRNEADHLLLRFTASPQEARSWVQNFSAEYVTSARRQLEERATYQEGGTPAPRRSRKDSRGWPPSSPSSEARLCGTPVGRPSSASASWTRAASPSS